VSKSIRHRDKEHRNNVKMSSFIHRDGSVVEATTGDQLSKARSVTVGIREGSVFTTHKHIHKTKQWHMHSLYEIKPHVVRRTALKHKRYVYMKSEPKRKVFTVRREVVSLTRSSAWRSVKPPHCQVLTAKTEGDLEMPNTIRSHQ